MTNPQIHVDGLADIFAAYSAIGKMFTSTPGLTAEQAYDAGGLAAVIVDRPSTDATSRGWKVNAGEDEDEKDSEDEFSRLNLQEVMAKALRLSRIEGAAGILVLTQDSPDMSAPLNLSAVGAITGLVAYGATAIKPEPGEYDDPTELNYGEPTHYLLTPPRGQAFVVHESRILRVTGSPTIRNAKSMAGPCWMGRPALDDETISAVAAVKQATQWAMRLLERKQQAVNKMQGLGQMVASGQEEYVRKRLQLIDLGRSVLNTVAVDKEDDFNVLDLSLTGVNEVLRELKSYLSACTAFMPVSVLFGETPTGLNATGRADLEFYYGGIASLQDRCVRPALERLTTIIYAQRGFSEPKQWHIEFEPMWIPSEQEEADAEDKKAARISKVADALAKFDAIGIMDPDELRNAAALMVPELKIEPGSEAPDEPAFDPNTGLPTDPAAAAALKAAQSTKPAPKGAA